ncbi:hypothetical protein [Piscirickettsia salmonis]|uniref:hypothetical protein n=1 Tax=Piscirickettsia salmonis TaxID=1238 RepID=UPI0007C8918E|nr:hypothetical protein A0O36_01572 [Piscirickettsiaceae bacterium NZ-RLO1]
MFDLIELWSGNIQPEIESKSYPRKINSSSVTAKFDAKTSQSSFEFTNGSPTVVFVSDKKTLDPVNRYRDLPSIELTDSERRVVAKKLRQLADNPKFYDGKQMVITAALYDPVTNTMYMEAKQVPYSVLATLRSREFAQESELYKLTLFQTGVLSPLVTKDDCLVLMERSQFGLMSQSGGFLEPVKGRLNFSRGDLVVRTAAAEITQEIAGIAGSCENRLLFTLPTISAVSIRMTKRRGMGTIEFIAPVYVNAHSHYLQQVIADNLAVDRDEHTGKSMVVSLDERDRGVLVDQVLTGSAVPPGQPLYLPMLISAARLVNPGNSVPRALPSSHSMAIPVSAMTPAVERPLPLTLFQHFEEKTGQTPDRSLTAASSEM